MRARRLVPVTVLALAALAACGGEPDSSADEEIPRITQPTETTSQPTPDPESPSDSGSSSPDSGPPRVSGTVASGLSVPWGLDFLPDGDAIVTERDSRRLLRVTPEGQVSELGTIDVAVPRGEAGLLGVAVPPDYDEDPRVYVYATSEEDNRILSVPLPGKRIGEPEVVLDGIPQGFTHDGGRLAFGPDGYLYASTGEVGDPELAQDSESLGGKILRITTDGTPAPGNPDEGSPVWSLGHRNVQGLAWDEGDRLWASEFGDSTWDELNQIVPGDNYGWPNLEGRGDQGGFTDPLLVWPTDEASPSGLAFLDGHLWMAGLRGQRLWRIPVTRDGVGRPRALFTGEYGRLRAVAAAPDGSLWVTTSNRDGRGQPTDADDRILRITP